MTAVPYEKGLICLGPDKAMQFLFAGLFSKEEALGFRIPSHEIETIVEAFARRDASKAHAS